MEFTKDTPGIRKYPDIISHLKKLYGKDKASEVIGSENSDETEMSLSMDYSEKIPDLFEKKLLRFSQLGEGNIGYVEELMKFKKIYLNFMDHDSPSKKTKMWNTAARRLRINIGAAAVIADGENLPEVFECLRYARKFSGGSFNGSLSRKSFDFLRRSHYGYTDPIAAELHEISFIIRFDSFLHGFHSQTSGYVNCLEHRLKKLGKNLSDSNILIIGAGLRGRGLADVLNKRSRSVIILDEDQQKALSICNDIRSEKKCTAAAYSLKDDILKIAEMHSIDVILNTTVIGEEGNMEKHSPLSPLNISADEAYRIGMRKTMDLSDINPVMIFADLSINRKNMTPFLQYGNELLLPVIDWKTMMIFSEMEEFCTLLSGEIERSGATKTDVFNIMNDAAFGLEINEIGIN